MFEAVNIIVWEYVMCSFCGCPCVYFPVFLMDFILRSIRVTVTVSAHTLCGRPQCLS